MGRTININYSHIIIHFQLRLLHDRLKSESDKENHNVLFDSNSDITPLLTVGTERKVKIDGFCVWTLD